MLTQSNGFLSEAVRIQSSFGEGIALKEQPPLRIQDHGEHQQRKVYHRNFQ